jgi:hypothetical protein
MVAGEPVEKGKRGAPKLGKESAVAGPQRPVAPAAGAATAATAPAAAARAGGIAKAALQEARAHKALQAGAGVTPAARIGGGNAEPGEKYPVVVVQQPQLEQQQRQQQQRTTPSLPPSLDVDDTDEKQAESKGASEPTAIGPPETKDVDSWADYGGHSSGDEVDVDVSARRLLSACRVACECSNKEAAAAVSQVREAFRRMQPRELVDAVDRAGNTGLHLAARAGRLELFRALYEQSPAMLGAENNDGLSPLDLASHRGCLALVLLAHDLNRQAVEQEHRDRDFFGCTTCGQLLAGRGRFQLTSCDKGRDHRWAAGSEPPRHIVALRAPNFAAAVAIIKSDLGRAAPRRGWWCKPQAQEQLSPLSPLQTR